MRFSPTLATAVVAACLTALPAGSAEGPAGRAPPGVSLVLEAVPPRTLPLLPVSLVVEVRNDGASAASVPNYFFVASVAGGSVEYADAFHGLPGVAARIELMPGESVRATLLSAVMQSRVVELHPDALSRPGVLGFRVAAGGVEGGATFVLASNDAVVAVEEPGGDDAGALARLREAMGEGFSGRHWNRVPGEVAAEVARRFPASVYNQALLPVSWAMPVDEIDRAIAIAPESHVAMGLRVLKARLLEERWWKARERGDLVAADDAARRAATTLDEIRRGTDDAFVVREVGELETKIGRAPGNLRSAVVP
jgi:hypothetical protein